MDKIHRLPLLPTLPYQSTPIPFLPYAIFPFRKRDLVLWGTKTKLHPFSQTHSSIYSSTRLYSARLYAVMDCKHLLFLPSGLECLCLWTEAYSTSPPLKKREGKGSPQNRAIQRKKERTWRRAAGALKINHGNISPGKLTDVKVRLHLSIYGSPSILCTTSLSLYYTGPIDTLQFLHAFTRSNFKPHHGSQNEMRTGVMELI